MHDNLCLKIEQYDQVGNRISFKWLKQKRSGEEEDEAQYFSH